MKTLTFYENFDRCKCGNCSREFLTNPWECVCCKQIDECMRSLESDQVVKDVGEETCLVRITEHPGFNPVCLQAWSLRMAADKYKTKRKSKRVILIKGYSYPSYYLSLPFHPHLIYIIIIIIITLYFNWVAEFTQSNFRLGPK